MKKGEIWEDKRTNGRVEIKSVETFPDDSILITIVTDNEEDMYWTDKHFLKMHRRVYQ